MDIIMQSNVWADKTFVLEQINSYRGAFKNASEELRDDKDVVMAALTRDPGIKKQDQPIFDTPLQYASKRLQRDPEVIDQAIRYSTFFDWKEIGPLTMKDKDLVCQYINPNFLILKQCDTELRSDPEFMLMATQVYYKAFEYADDSLKNDPAFVLRVIEKVPDAYEDAGETVKQMIGNEPNIEGKLRAIVERQKLQELVKTITPRPTITDAI